MLAHGLLNHCGNSQEDMQAPLKTSEAFQDCSVFSCEGRHGCSSAKHGSQSEWGELDESLLPIKALTAVL